MRAIALALTVALAATLAAPGALGAQDSAGDRGYALTGRVGFWMLEGSIDPYGSFAAGLRFAEHVVVDVEFAGANLGGSACDVDAGAPGSPDGPDAPATVDDCGDDTWLKLLTLAPRIEFTGENSRPYIGGILGVTAFGRGGGVVGGRVGVLQEVTAGTTLLFEGTYQLVGVRGSFERVTALGFGVSLEL